VFGIDGRGRGGHSRGSWWDWSEGGRGAGGWVSAGLWEGAERMRAARSIGWRCWWWEARRA
jgi:hypothetical protein